MIASRKAANNARQFRERELHEYIEYIYDFCTSILFNVRDIIWKRDLRFAGVIIFIALATRI